MTAKPQKQDVDRPECPQCGREMSFWGMTDSGERPRYKCSPCGIRTTATGAASFQWQGYDEGLAQLRFKALKKIAKRKRQRYIVTSAVNNSPKATQAWRALLNAAEHLNAEIIVIPIHYKNPSLFTGNQKYKKWFAKHLEPYILDDDLYLGGRIMVMAGHKIQATAADPLAGMETIGGPSRWCIYGATSMHMETIPSPANRPPKRIYSTGCITQSQYSRSKAGSKAHHHHVTGALLAEVDGRNAWVRQLNADHKGVIYDLEHRYTPEGVERHNGILALVTGDEHVKFMARAVKEATYTGEDSISKVLRPKYLVRHDVLDGYAGSHHHEGQYLTQYRKFHRRDNNYRAELRQVVAHLHETTDEGQKNLIVPSNHHDHLQKWLDRADDRKDPMNADLICELRALQYQAAREGGETDPFQIYLQPRLKVHAEFLNRNIPYLLGGVDVSQHGDAGPNGSRGSRRALAKASHKMVIGHTHSPGIYRSIYQTGKSTMRLEYERGLSSHTQAHCLIYPNGKRAIIEIIGKRWRMS